MKKVYHRAFFDLLKEKVAETPPAYDWITRLYGEIKKRLLALLRLRSRPYGSSRRLLFCCRMAILNKEGGILKYF